MTFPFRTDCHSAIFQNFVDILGNRVGEQLRQFGPTAATKPLKAVTVIRTQATFTGSELT